MHTFNKDFIVKKIFFFILILCHTFGTPLAETGSCACVETEQLCLFLNIGNKMIPYVSPVDYPYQ